MTTDDASYCTCNEHGMSPDIPQCGRCGEHGDGVCADEEHDEPKPERIQRRRTKGWKMPANTIYVGRGTKWGNPWRIEDGMSPRGCVWRYRDAVNGLLPFAQVPGPNEIRTDLAGKNLACWCPLTDAQGNHVPCHADVLLELANPTAPVGDTDTTPKETK